MRVLFLNQYFPPDTSPTGSYLQEVASILHRDGHIIDMVGSDETYRRSSKKGGRIYRDISALCRILLKGLKVERPDLIISGTSPPCLLIIASILAFRFRSRSIHWAFDIYPELALALKELRPSWITKSLEILMQFFYQRCERVIALDEDMRDFFMKFGVQTEIIRPWALVDAAGKKTDPYSDKNTDSRIWTWMYSGNLGRAHEWETLLQAQAIIERATSDVYLCFQGGGPSWPKAQQKAGELGLKNCLWKPYAPEGELRDSLLKAQCNIVTQRPETRGFLWPSKLSLVLQLSRPILWLGPKESSIAERLRAFPVAGIFNPGENEAVAFWIQSLRECNGQFTCAGVSETDREEALQLWRKVIDSVNPTSEKGYEELTVGGQI